MNFYLLFKSLHLIAVISWMAGLLYLPRIFVYHSEAVQNNKSEDLMSTFKVMERRLFVYIMNPSMLLSWLFGFLLLHSIGIDSLAETWMITKLAHHVVFNDDVPYTTTMELANTMRTTERDLPAYPSLVQMSRAANR